MKVSWGSYSQYMEKWFQTINHITIILNSNSVGQSNDISYNGVPSDYHYHHRAHISLYIYNIEQ